MQPGTFDLKRGVDSGGNEYDARIYQGDTYDAINVITIPNLASRGRPSTLEDATVSAQVRSAGQELLGVFSVEVIDEEERQIKLTMTPAATRGLPITRGAFWDLQVVWGGYTDTILRGKVEITRHETN